MENKINYTLIGLFFVIVVSAAGGFMWWMISYGNDKSDYRSYYILTSDLPRGIKKDSQVKFIGVDAGVVKNIRFADPKDAKIEIELWIREGLPIKKDSAVVTEIQGITGISYLNIQKGSDESPVFSEDEKPYLKIGANFFEKIGEKAEDITQNINTAFINLNKILNDENAAKFASILSSLDELAINLNKASSNSDINGTLKNINDTLLEYKALAKSGVTTIDNINSSLDGFKNLAIKLEDLQSLVQSKIASGEYDIKDMLNSLSDDATLALAEFQKALKEFRQTLFRLEDKPYEFFFKDPKSKQEKDEK